MARRSHSSGMTVIPAVNGLGAARDGRGACAGLASLPLAGAVSPPPCAAVGMSSHHFPSRGTNSQHTMKEKPQYQVQNTGGVTSSADVTLFSKDFAVVGEGSEIVSTPHKPAG